MGSKRAAIGLSAGLWAVFAALLITPGGLAITKHSGDALHMVAIVDRLTMGQLPHLDFMTPIGILAFWPIAVFTEAGLSVGQAFAASQVAMGALLGAASLAIVLRRVTPLFALLTTALVLVLTMALLHGEAAVAVSVSMHYNRWAWALGFVAVVAAFIAPTRAAAWEGVLLGAIVAALPMIKVTYFAALILPIVLGLLLTGQKRLLLIAGATGLVIGAVLTVVLGLGYWSAYLSDLLAVSGSEVRAQPGLDLTQIFTAPAYLGGTLVAFAMVAVLRRGGFANEGLLVLLLTLAGGYITFQNFGNDPQWLALLALLLAVWALRAEAARLPLFLGATALAAMIAPSFINLAGSPLRHARIDTAAYMPLLVGAERNQDLLTSITKGNRMRANTPLGRGTQVFNTDPRPEPATFLGRPLEECGTEPVASYFASITTDLKARGLAQGGRIFSVDILNPYWLYGDHPPLRGGAPWYYSGLPGIEDADFVLLPACPIVAGVRRLILAELADTALTEVIHTPLYTLYALERS